MPRSAPPNAIIALALRPRGTGTAAAAVTAMGMGDVSGDGIAGV